MAIPRVFISSTCFDLADVRDSLVSFCQSFGFEATLSDKGDVFYHPDLHTHDSCLSEIQNCQLFILIIGGRFGGSYKYDISKSITNAEYLAARKLNIPVFTFIKYDVLSDHRLFQKNKESSFSTSIIYPSIADQTYACYIFEFIDIVRLSDFNNGFFGFNYSREIQDLLRKQLAGMFFNFLTNRQITEQLKTTNNSIAQLSVASSKIEELIKMVYKQVDNINAETAINKIIKESRAKELLVNMSKVKGNSFLFKKVKIGDLVDTTYKWHRFICQAEGFEEKRIYSKEQDIKNAVIYKPTSFLFAFISGDISEDEIQKSKDFEDMYKNFRSLDQYDRRELLLKFSE